MSNFLWLIQLQIPSIPENISNVTDTTDLALAAINMFLNQYIYYIYIYKHQETTSTFLQKLSST